uniref:(California timema) hypothetical protein n=1 Tax=Timema californicum TaxID=61474 RepID=A0A7R9PF43_TIMCA|nr:unnamed protein product [Timema californicum]
MCLLMLDHINWSRRLKKTEM